MSNKKMQCVIRLDDITPDMDWDKFHKAEGIFDRYGVKPLLGVVPQNCDATLHFTDTQEQVGPDVNATQGKNVSSEAINTPVVAINQTFKDCIQAWQEKGWAFAQHGTYHVYETKDSGILGINPFSEFAGLPLEAQKEKLKAGRDMLQSLGVNTDIFMAPGHTYDRNTLQALKETGFTSITDGLYYRPYLCEGILCVPCRMTSNYKIKGFDTICIHTNLMEENDFRKLEQFCKAHAENIVPFQTELFRNNAVKRNTYVKLYEATVLWRRQLKDKIAHSNRLIWYMEWTNHKNSKIKWAKRILFIPAILFADGNKDR